MEEENILEFEHVTLQRKGFSIDDATFSIKKGYITVLMGDNGAGKTTLLSLLMGKKQKYTGSIRLNGRDIWKNREYYLDRVGIISEEPYFFMERDAIENAEILGRFYSQWDMELYKKTLQKMNISWGTQLGRLSRGNYIKFQFAWAMAHQPFLYIMDEPTAGLDPVYKVEFAQMLQELVTEESSVLLSTNIWSDVARIADYKLEIANGRIVGMEEVDHVG